MAIDIRNFVNININRNVQLTLDGSRPVVRLYGTTYEGTLIGCNSDYTKFYTSTDNTTAANITNAKDKQFAKVFFANGGCKLMMIKDALPTDTDSLMKIPDEHVILATEATMTAEQINTFAEVLNSLKGIHQKIFVNRITTAPTTTSSFIVSKYSDVEGSEMAIAAYLSQIKFYENGSPVDYDFTKENITDADGNHDTLGKSLTFTDPDTLIKNSFNFEMQVGEDYYNIGGNSTDGQDVVEQLGIIIMQQDLTTSVFKTLASKVSGQKGIAAIRTAMSEVLDNFVSSGFLITNQVWTKSDLVLPNKVDGNKPNETVITKNTPLSAGYIIHMFRLSTNLRKVYAAIVVATNKGIRYVEVDGKAI
jgi:hypothetical protein